MECPTCNSICVRNGFYKDFQKFKCRNCQRQFSERSLSFFCRHRFPDEVIRNGITYNFFVSTRVSKFLLQETLQFSPSNTSIYRWTVKFAEHSANLKRSRIFSNIWHVDEKFIKVRGSKDDFAYLWVVIDDKNSIIAVHVSQKRDINGATAVLTKANRISEKPPDILISDGLQAYNKACRKVFGRKTKHIKAHFKTVIKMIGKKLYLLSNNRIESLNSKINLWYKRFRGFKRLATANLWCAMWMHFYNLIRPRVIPHKTISIHAII